MLPTLKSNATAGYQGPVKIKLLEDEGLPKKVIEVIVVAVLEVLSGVESLEKIDVLVLKTLRL